jgi:hypothetical protein
VVKASEPIHPVIHPLINVPAVPSSAVDSPVQTAMAEDHSMVYPRTPGRLVMGVAPLHQVQLEVGEVGGRMRRLALGVAMRLYQVRVNQLQSLLVPPMGTVIILRVEVQGWDQEQVQ